MGRSVSLPPAAYRGRDGMPTKSSCAKRNGFLEASNIGTANSWQKNYHSKRKLHTGFVKINAIWQLAVEPIRRSSITGATKCPDVLFGRGHTGRLPHIGQIYKRHVRRGTRMTTKTYLLRCIHHVDWRALISSHTRKAPASLLDHIAAQEKPEIFATHHQTELWW